MGVESEPLFMSLQSVLGRPHIPVSHTAPTMGRTFVIQEGEERTWESQTMAYLPPLVTWLKINHLLEVKLFHPVLFKKKKKNGWGGWAGTNPAPWRTYWDHVREDYENINEIARDAWKNDTQQSIPSNSAYKPRGEGREPRRIAYVRTARRTVTEHLTSWGRTEDINARASKLTEEGAGLTSHVIWTQLDPRNTLSVLFYLNIHLYTQE